MSNETSSAPEGATSPEHALPTAAPAVIALAVAAFAAVPQKLAPPAWATKKRPSGVLERDARTHFDARFAGAKAAGRWEDEWPLLTEADFDAALEAAGSISLGGHQHDGTYPTTFEG
jgi:hypothetical protein